MNQSHERAWQTLGNGVGHMMSLKGVTAPLRGVSALLWGVAALLSGVVAPLRLLSFSPSAPVIMFGLGPRDSHRQLEELLALVVVGVVLVLPLVPLDEELTAELLLLLLLLPPGATELFITPATRDIIVSIVEYYFYKIALWSWTYPWSSHCLTDKFSGLFSIFSIFQYFQWFIVVVFKIYFKVWPPLTIGSLYYKLGSHKASNLPSHAQLQCPIVKNPGNNWKMLSNFSSRCGNHDYDATFQQNFYEGSFTTIYSTVQCEYLKRRQ